MKILLMLLLFVLPAVAQKTVSDLEKEAKSLRNGKRYSVEYDKFEDRTSVKFFSFGAKPNKESRLYGMPRFGLSFSFAGKELTSTVEKFYFSFWSVSNEWLYLKNRELIFLADDERFSLGDGRRDGKIERRSVSEYIVYSMSRKEVEQIASGATVEFKLGGFMSALEDEHKEMFKDMLKLGKL